MVEQEPIQVCYNTFVNIIYNAFAYDMCVSYAYDTIRVCNTCVYDIKKCSWDSDEQKCRKKCSFYDREGNCPSQYCNWNASEFKCDEK